MQLVRQPPPLPLLGFQEPPGEHPQILRGPLQLLVCVPELRRAGLHVDFQLLLRPTQLIRGLANAQKGPDARNQFLGLHRLGEVIVRPQIQTADATAGANNQPGNQDYKGVLGLLLRLEPAAKLPAIRIRQDHIQQDELSRVFCQHRPRLRRRTRHPHLKPGVLDEGRKQLDDDSIIIHQQHPVGGLGG